MNDCKFGRSQMIKLKTKLLWMLVICSMIIIFMFSAQEAKTSNHLSTGVSQKISKVMVDNYDELSHNQQIEVVKRINSTIREMAHFSNFLILGYLLIWLLKTQGFSFKRRVAITALLGLAYAVIDEMHQYFVPGRGMQLTDIFMDFFGVIMGIIMFEVILKLSKIWDDKTL